MPARRPFQTIRPHPKDDETVRYRTAKSDCEACELKLRCCPRTPTRYVTRSIHEGPRDLARDFATTDVFVASKAGETKGRVLFAHMKKIMGLDRLRLRGPNGAKDEFTLAATVQNLRKMAKLLPAPA
ncbi:MAG: transposase [Pseudomonadota bacterium]